jgi:hypothetical protein
MRNAVPHDYISTIELPHFSELRIYWAFCSYQIGSDCPNDGDEVGLPTGRGMFQNSKNDLCDCELLRHLRTSSVEKVYASKKLDGSGFQ